MRRILITITATLFAAITFAQGGSDALQFSQTYYQGTAKALGMGNALGAVGGDMTAICINPAGMGLYRGPELTMSLNLSDNFITSDYYGTSQNGNKLRLSIPNIAYVSCNQKSNYKPLRYSQFCIGLTRTNDYNIRTHAKGLNPTSSKIDNYLDRIDGYSPNELQDAFAFDIFPAWSTYLIDIYEDTLGEYYSSPVPQGGIMQSFDQDFKGRSEEWTFGYSVNMRDRLFLGISLGIPHIKRVGSRVFGETLPENSDINTDFNSWTYTEDFSSKGIGVNAKLGLIWAANRWLRLGASIHTPTAYSFDESWQTETESQIAWVTRKSLSPQSNYEYNFISPAKCVGSMAFVVGDIGMVSLDAEYTNYGAAKFTADDYDYTTVNQEIKEFYGRTFNFRIGTEWNVGDTYLRMGAGYYGSPYGFGQSDGSVKKASVGISYQLSLETRLDLAYELSYGKNRFTLYDAGSLGIEPVEQRQLRNNIALTLRIH